MRLVAPSHATQTQLYRAVVQRLLGPESKPCLAPGLSVPGSAESASFLQNPNIE